MTIQLRPSWVTLTAATVVAVSSTGCCRLPIGSDPAPEPAKPAAVTPAVATKPGAPVAPVRPAPAPAPVANPNAMGPDGLPIEIPATRSPVPTVAEWGAVTREITVRRSTPLGCETKMVREWVRVSCRGKNDVGGTPLDVKKLGGCADDTYVFSSGGVTSVVTPVLRGKECDVRFTWTMGGALLWVHWPRGAPRPTIAFQG